MTFVIVIAVVVVAALVLGYRYDRKHRSQTSATSRRTARQTRVEGREKGSQWGAGAP